MSSLIYTLVTGASNGIGKALAEDCASRGHHVLLAALPEPKLEEVANELKSRYPQQSFHYLGIDLMKMDSAQEILAWCNQNEFQVDILINNAGLGNSGPFTSLPTEFYQGQMQLNMLSLVSLTHLFLPMLMAKPKAYILNVSSMAGFFDVPYKGIYSASKKFVLSFSRSLNKELESSSVSISVLCPGGVLTNEDVKLRTQQLGLVARKAALQPEKVAKHTIDKMLAGKEIIIPGTLPKIIKLFSSILPYSVRVNMMANQFIKNTK